MILEEDAILREKDLQQIDGLSESQRRVEMREGRYSQSFPLTPDPKCRARGFSRREVLERVAAVKAQATADELRALVVEQVKRRSMP